MNRSGILDHLKAFPYDRSEYWIITGGAMVLYGFREQTGDIDLGCSCEMADQLEKDGYLYQITADGKRWFKYNSYIEIVEEWLEDTTQEVDGFQVISVKGLIIMKQEMGREKDFQDIETIKRSELQG